MSDSNNRSLALSLLAIVAGMIMLSYAAVPLYRIFCQMTGFGGTPRVAAQAPAQTSEKTITVYFNADTDPNLPWKFTPVQRSQVIRLGEQSMAAYRAENLTNKVTRGTATYNVNPPSAGGYFNKIHCFCFEQQTLNPGQVVNMPVSYFIDPKILSDPDLAGVKSITLSYTFFSETSANH